MRPMLKLTSLVLALLLVLPLRAQETDAFDRQSMALRTALHYDPSLATPLEQLVKLYQSQDRQKELVAIYEAHLAQYPNDPSAKAVLIRVQRALGDPQAKVLTQQAAQQFADQPYIQFLSFEQLLQDADPAALAALSRAIDLEPRPDRKMEWLDRLLAEADGAEDRVIARKHLAALEQTAGADPAALYQLALKMHQYGFHDLGLATLGKVVNPAPEMQVDVQILAAKFEASLGKSAEAGTRLDTLLTQVAPDYWRRAEILTLRIQLLDSNAARETILASARARYQAESANPEAALNLGQMLEAAGLRQEAAQVLTEASIRLPHVAALETKALEALERLNQENRTADYLEKRLLAEPARDDLRYRLVQSLYLSGNAAEAQVEFDLIAKNLTLEQLAERQLDLGRFLRRMNLAKEATTVFESALKTQPARLESRRELAEAHLATGNRDAARQMIASSETVGAAIEVFLDYVQFMISQDFLTEARAALTSRIEVEKDNLDIRMLQADVLGRVGDQKAGRALLDESRSLADTRARYRQWLERAMEFHAEFDGVDLFFDEEQARLLGGVEAQWTEEQIARFLILCEAGDKNRLTDRVAHLLRSQLDGGGLPPALELEVRRLLAQTLADDPAYVLEVEAQLKALLAADAARGDEYRLRLGLLYHRNQRPDLAGPLLGEVSLDTIQDTPLLKEATPVFLELNLSRSAQTALRRLTAIEADNRLHWEKLLNLLAATGQEAEFRKTLRELRGNSKLELNAESLAALEKHLADSYWRSIAPSIHAGPGAAPEALALLDGLERNLGPREDRLWALWARAYLLNSLGQTEARDQVVEDLMSRAQVANLKEIGFPDGLSIRLGAIEQILKEPAPITESSPPLAEISDASIMRWAFESDPGSTIVQIKPAGALVMVMDNRRTVYGVDRATGKLRWRNIAPAPAPAPVSAPPAAAGSSTVIHFSGGNITVQGGGNVVINSGGTLLSNASGTFTSPRDPAFKTPRLQTDAAGRFYLADQGVLRGFETATGSLLWELPLVPEASAPASAPALEFELAGDRLLGFDPLTGVAAAVEAGTGKLLWKSEEGLRNAATPSPLRPLNAGLSGEAGRLIVYGDHCAVLDAETGAAIWTFRTDSPSRFPLRLQTDEEKAALAGTSAFEEGRTDHAVNYFASAAQRGKVLESFLDYRASLVAPAVKWAAQGERAEVSRHAVIQGKKLLLMGEDGVGIYSLDLPLASRQIPVRGAYLGGFGGKAVFLAAKGITVLDLADGESRVIPLPDDLPENARVEAFVHVHRIYAITASGVRCWNLHTGRHIFDLPWPPMLVAYAQPRHGFQRPSDARYEWQGVAWPSQTANGAGRVCYSMRSTADGDMLFVLVGENSMAAFGPSGNLATR